MRKNKKLLLASVAAMGALALGVGATSTFAWFGVSNASNVLASPKTGDATPMTVTKTDHAADNINIPMLVTVSTTTTQSNLLLAHYNSDASQTNTTYRQLSSGYVDNNDQFHEEKTLTEFGANKVLFGDLKITVALDFSVTYSSGVRAGWSGGTQNNGVYEYGSEGAYLPAYWTTSDGVSYDYDTIMGVLDDDTVNVYIQAVEGYARGRIIEHYAISTEPFYTKYANSTDSAATAEAEGTYQGYVKCATGAALTGINTGPVDVKTGMYFYVHGDRTDEGTSAETGNVTAKFQAAIE